MSSSTFTREETVPAELTNTDGTADFFEVGSRRSAWHREGHLIPPDRAITLPES